MKSGKVVHSSSANEEAVLDRLSTLLARFRVRAALFHAGALCGVSTFDARPGRAFLHVLRRGSMEVRHRPRGRVERLRVKEPMLLFYPRPLRHQFVNPPRDGPDFVCATLDFDGADRNPLVQSLPAFIGVPLREVDGLRPALDLLFDEADRRRCGSSLLIERLFEVVLIQLLRWIVDHPARAGVSRGLLAGLADPRLARALVAVHRAPESAWTLERMAAIAGLSRSAFAAAFRRTTGLTPAAYVTDWRLTLAASLLRAGQPVKAIATDLGFGSASSLSKAFRQRMGASPRAWRDALEA